MQPFSAELLSILVLISISWSGVIFIAVVILIIFLTCKSCSKRRRPGFIHPKQTHSPTISVSDSNDSVTKTPLPTEYLPHGTNKQKLPEKHHYLDDTISVTNEHTNPFYNKNTKSQQKTYTHDNNDRTTTTMHEHGTNNRNYHVRRPHNQTVQPISNVPAVNRPTPYPQDVIARDRLMNRNRFPIDLRY
ncbi:unnamed protein product [Rotaria socialis]|uniref:Uncharacterized protein n=1 Tax=Rotaria socialis TaxID=392032 RepID=A0A817LK25_9BILA|nr:unnamed protein product [Rotaria socialis]CAF3315297.1 unnamed protein product [Rotaria socialis]CAF3343204.1 unnamed protein product [Rotaria socialis]CAF3483864.1 unnamed protein product [Rotaria socialis]CAF3752498.1 unnamed protein product [Rotaria socialis]